MIKTLKRLVILTLLVSLVPAGFVWAVWEEAPAGDPTTVNCWDTTVGGESNPDYREGCQSPINTGIVGQEKKGLLDVYGLGTVINKLPTNAYLTVKNLIGSQLSGSAGIFSIFGSGNIGRRLVTVYDSLRVNGGTGNNNTATMLGLTDSGQNTRARTGLQIALSGQAGAANSLFLQGWNHMTGQVFSINRSGKFASAGDVCTTYNQADEVEKCLSTISSGSSWANNGTNIYNTNTGNVGVGTNNPNTFKLQIGGDVGPDVDNNYSLGSPTMRWKNLYASQVYTCSGPGSCSPVTGANVVANPGGSGLTPLTSVTIGATDYSVGGGSSLPAGTANQTLRHNGTAWVATSNLSNDGGTVNVSSGGATNIFKVTPNGANPSTFVVNHTGQVGIGTTGTIQGDLALEVLGGAGNVHAKGYICSGTIPNQKCLSSGTTGSNVWWNRKTETYEPTRSILSPITIGDKVVLGTNPITQSPGLSLDVRGGANIDTLGSQQVYVRSSGNGSLFADKLTVGTTAGTSDPSTSTGLKIKVAGDNLPSAVGNLYMNANGTVVVKPGSGVELWSKTGTMVSLKTPTDLLTLGPTQNPNFTTSVGLLINKPNTDSTTEGPLFMSRSGLVGVKPISSLTNGWTEDTTNNKIYPTTVSRDVVIGGTTPVEAGKDRLSVVGNVASGPVRQTIKNDSGSGWASLRLMAGGTPGAVAMNGPSASGLANMLNISAGTGGTGGIVFTTGGGATSNERMRITSTGSVGIGTNSPTAGTKLDVNGALLANSLTTNGIYLNGGNTLELGVGLTKFSDAGKIIYGSNALNLIGGASSARPYKINLFDDVNVNGSLTLPYGRITTGTQSAGVSWLGDVDGAKWTTSLGNYGLTFLNDSGTGYRLNGVDPLVGLFGRQFNPKVQLTSDGKIYALTDVCAAGKCLSQIGDGGSGGPSQWLTSGSGIYYNAGNVGVGTAPTTNRLEVAGNASVSGAINISSDGTNKWIMALNNSKLVFKNQGPNMANEDALILQANSVVSIPKRLYIPNSDGQGFALGGGGDGLVLTSNGTGYAVWARLSDHQFVTMKHVCQDGVCSGSGSAEYSFPSDITVNPGGSTNYNCSTGGYSNNYCKITCPVNYPRIISGGANCTSERLNRSFPLDANSWVIGCSSGADSFSVVCSR